MGKEIVRYRGNKINLCALRADDEAVLEYTKWMNDEAILQWIGRQARFATFEAEKEWAEQRSKEDKPNFNIVTREGKLIGNCGISMRGRTATLGICIGDVDSRNKGYGTETIALLVRFAFEEMNAHRVALALDGDNMRAHRCYEKAGFIECGREHEVSFWGGRYHDHIRMEILEDTYWESLQQSELYQSLKG